MKGILCWLLLAGSAATQVTVFPKTTIFPKSTLFGTAGSGGSIAHVQTSTCGGQTVSSGITTCTLTSTVVSGDFLACSVVGANGQTLVSMTANPGSVAMTQAFLYIAGRMPIGVWFTPNSTAFTSAVANFSSSNGSISSTDCEEYSGLSATAAVVNTAVTYDSGFVSTTTWGPTGSYTATSSNLLLSGSAASAYTGSWGAGSGWTLEGNYATAPISIMVQQQLSPTAGSYTASGTLSSAGAGTYYDAWIVSFK